MSSGLTNHHRHFLPPGPPEAQCGRPRGSRTRQPLGPTPMASSPGDPLLLDFLARRAGHETRPMPAVRVALRILDMGQE